ncbi:MAG: hypothetical protein M3311_06085 [Thermoproteota archaeon]|nr:hypothetical protein [Thermoproteota archaeon]
MEDKQGSSSHNTHNQDYASGTEGESKTSSMHEQHQHHHHSPQPNMTTLTASTSMMHAMTNYNVNVQFNPPTPQAGKPTSLSFVVSEQKVGEPIKQFDIIHDKLMHLIIVNREDLSHFAHIHPKLDEKTGIFHVVHTFAKAGNYKLWIDTKPRGGIQILTAFAFNVEGQPVHSRSTIVPEQTRVKNVVVTDGQTYQISLNCQPEQLVAGRNVKMTFEIKDANEKPITNLEQVMAAGGHCVIIDASGREFLHVHPAEEIHDASNWRGGPSVSFLASFPNPGLYRAWGQFQHEGKLLTADFTFEVVAG